MESHFNFLGLLWIIYGSALALLAVVFLLIQLVFWGGGQTAGELLALAVFQLPGIAGGLMLRRRMRGAKVILFILALLNLLSFPIGTALGFYTLFVLLRRPRRRLPSPGTEGPLT